MVNHVKATGLADREENHITEFSSRALHASTAGIHQAATAGQCCKEGSGIIQVGEITIIHQDIHCRNQPQMTHPGENVARTKGSSPCLPTSSIVSYDIAAAGLDK